MQERSILCPLALCRRDHFCNFLYYKNLQWKSEKCLRSPYQSYLKKRLFTFSFAPQKECKWSQYIKEIIKIKDNECEYQCHWRDGFLDLVLLALTGWWPKIMRRFLTIGLVQRWSILASPRIKQNFPHGRRYRQYVTFNAVEGEKKSLKWLQSHDGSYWACSSANQVLVLLEGG